jgi:hypothetical protein
VLQTQSRAYLYVYEHLTPPFRIFSLTHRTIDADLGLLSLQYSATLRRDPLNAGTDIRHSLIVAQWITADSLLIFRTRTIIGSVGNTIDSLIIFRTMNIIDSVKPYYGGLDLPRPTLIWVCACQIADSRPRSTAAGIRTGRYQVTHPYNEYHRLGLIERGPSHG